MKQKILFKIKEFENRKILIIAILFSIIYFIAWKYLAAPYRLFPSDDRGVFIKFLNTNSIFDAFDTYMPVYFIAIKLIDGLFSGHLISSLLNPALTAHGAVFECNPVPFRCESLLITAIISNSIILFLLCQIIYSITKNYLSVILGAVIYGTSAYSANYYFLQSYTPFATMLMLFALNFLFNAPKTDYKGFYLAMSSVFAGLFLWSSPSSAVMISLLIITVCYLFNPVNQQNNRKRVFLFLTIFLATIAIFAIKSAPFLIEHLRENIKTDHYSHAFEKFGYVPKPPFLSFFYILSVYNLPLLIFFLFCSLGVVGTLLSDKIKKVSSGILGDGKHTIYILLILIWAHLIIIDLLPFTKLGRTHFVIYPLVIIVIASFFSYVQRYIISLNGRIIIVLIAGVIIAANIHFSLRLIYSRTAVPKYLETTFVPKIQDIYTVSDDPHSLRLMAWLENFNMREGGNLKQFISEIMPNRKHAIGLILGPQGKGSGLSTMRHCVLDDFVFDKNYEEVLLRKANVTKVLPYYGQFPSFLMEEEICQALYFEGKIVNKANITFLYFD